MEEQTLDQILREHSSFVNSLKPGDYVIVELGPGVYKEAIVESEVYVAPSENRYINIKAKISNSQEKPYAVPAWVIYPVGSKKITNTNYAYINYAGCTQGPYFSGRGTYNLVFEGKVIKKAYYCTGRKMANRELTDEDLLRNYDISKVFSKGELIYNIG